MENNNRDDELDKLIRASMEMTDIPSPQLNSRVKATLYQREAALRQHPVRAVSLWYLPMLLNLITFLLLAVAALLMVANPHLARLAALVCGYIAVAGVVLTALGVRRANMKKAITIYIERRGVPA